MYTALKSCGVHEYSLYTPVCVYISCSVWPRPSCSQEVTHCVTLFSDSFPWNFWRIDVGSFAATVTFPWTEKTKWVKRKQNCDALGILTQLSCKSFDWDRRNVMKCLSTLPTPSSVHKTAACRDDRSRTDPGSWHLSQSRVSSAQWLLTIVSDLAMLFCLRYWWVSVRPRELSVRRHQVAKKREGVRA